MGGMPHVPDEFVRQAVLAPSSHNTQPWTFRLTDRALGRALS